MSDDDGLGLEEGQKLDDQFENVLSTNPRAYFGDPNFAKKLIRYHFGPMGPYDKMFSMQE